MNTKLLAGALLLALTPVATMAASDTGGLKQIPANGYAKSAKVEAFKDNRENAYENVTYRQVERDKMVQGRAYGDQPNKIPARNKYYRDNRGIITTDEDGIEFRDRRGVKHY